jgi:hypothetical protein
MLKIDILFQALVMDERATMLTTAAADAVNDLRLMGLTYDEIVEFGEIHPKYLTQIFTEHPYPELSAASVRRILEKPRVSPGNTGWPLQENQITQPQLLESRKLVSYDGITHDHGATHLRPPLPSQTPMREPDTPEPTRTSSPFDINAGLRSLPQAVVGKPKQKFGSNRFLKNLTFDLSDEELVEDEHGGEDLEKIVISKAEDASPNVDSETADFSRDPHTVSDAVGRYGSSHASQATSESSSGTFELSACRTAIIKALNRHKSLAALQRAEIRRLRDQVVASRSLGEAVDDCDKDLEALEAFSDMVERHGDEYDRMRLAVDSFNMSYTQAGKSQNSPLYPESNSAAAREGSPQSVSEQSQTRALTCERLLLDVRESVSSLKAVGSTLEKLHSQTQLLMTRLQAHELHLNTEQTFVGELQSDSTIRYHNSTHFDTPTSFQEATLKVSQKKRVSSGELNLPDPSEFVSTLSMQKRRRTSGVSQPDILEGKKH